MAETPAKDVLALRSPPDTRNTRTPALARSQAVSHRRRSPPSQAGAAAKRPETPRDSTARAVLTLHAQWWRAQPRQHGSGSRTLVSESAGGGPVLPGTWLPSVFEACRWHPRAPGRLRDELRRGVVVSGPGTGM